MTKQIYDKILAEGFKSAVDKMDPQMIFSLASDVISSFNDLKQMRIKGEIILGILKEHEQTVRRAMEQHTEQTNNVISALKMLIDKSESKEEKMEYLRHLVAFGSHSLEKLHLTSQTALNNIPKLPGGNEK